MNKHIAVYGEALIDFTYENGAFIPHPGGSPYNVAIGLGRLKSDVEYCTQVSSDMFGDILLNYLKNNNVKINNINTVNKPTTLAFVKVAEDGKPSYAFYSNGAADVDIEADLLNRINIDAKIHHFGSIATQQEPCANFWENYIKKIGPTNFISFDPNIRSGLIQDREKYLKHFYNIIQYTDFLKLSDEDMNWIAPMLNKNEFVRSMKEKGVKAIAITEGSKGAHFYFGGKTYSQKALLVTVGDTVGAGDTFAAALLRNLVSYVKGKFFVGINDNVIINCLQEAIVAASLNCKKKGANPPTLHELEQALKMDFEVR